MNAAISYLVAGGAVVFGIIAIVLLGALVVSWMESK